MIGRSASKILHRIASESYASNARHANPYRVSFTKFYSMSRFLSDCEMGRITAFLNIVSELFGSVLFAALWSWSVSNSRRPPFDGTLIFFLSSLAAFVLYVCSFALHLNPAGEFAPHPKDGSGHTSIRRLLSFLREVIAVSAGDMASLFEERNWASSSVLGRRRPRSFSEVSCL
jgi:hypothetical protein